jgi:hypothetical protein
VDALIFMGFGNFSGMSSVFAAGKTGPSLVKWLKKIDGFEEKARAAAKILDSGDRKQILGLVRLVLEITINTFMPTKATEEMDVFLDALSEALTSEEMLESGFLPVLRNLFASVTGETSENEGALTMMDLMDPIPAAIVGRLIRKYKKPVLTTTFTETNTTLGEGGYYPYPNSDRASNVLAKLLEYGEFLFGCQEVL